MKLQVTVVRVLRGRVRGADRLGSLGVADAVAFTRAVGAGRSVLLHHEPRHSDGLLEQLEDRARELANENGGPSPTLEHEGWSSNFPDGQRRSLSDPANHIAKSVVATLVAGDDRAAYALVVAVPGRPEPTRGAPS